MKIKRKPPWLKVSPPWGREFSQTSGILKRFGLETVCKNANCPNIGECYSSGTATFLIMGNVCTRNCRFCNIDSGEPPRLDADEPIKAARAVKAMNLSYAVVTSVTRDDLPDGGAAHFAETIKRIKSLNPGCPVEVLVPDFKGNTSSLDTVLAAAPDVFNHNVETVPRLYPELRPGADYSRSLRVLEYVNKANPRMPTKSGLMVGAGETRDELRELFSDLAEVGVRILTIGQYLPPSADHHPLDRYYHPEEFREMQHEASETGIDEVISAPLVRSSYHAKKLLEKLMAEK